MEILIGVVVIAMMIKILEIAFKLAYSVGCLVLMFMTLPFILIFAAASGLFLAFIPLFLIIMIITALSSRRRVN